MGDGSHLIPNFLLKRFYSGIEGAVFDKGYSYCTGGKIEPVSGFCSVAGNSKVITFPSGVPKRLSYCRLKDYSDVHMFPDYVESGVLAGGFESRFSILVRDVFDKHAEYTKDDAADIAIYMMVLHNLCEYVIRSKVPRVMTKSDCNAVVSSTRGKLSITNCNEGDLDVCDLLCLFKRRVMKQVTSYVSSFGNKLTLVVLEIPDTSKCRFVLGDDPVMVFNNIDSSGLVDAECLYRDGACLLMPFSPRKAFLVFDEGTYTIDADMGCRGYIRLTDSRDILLIDTYQVRESRRFVTFSSHWSQRMVDFLCNRGVVSDFSFLHPRGCFHGTSAGIERCLRPSNGLPSLRVYTGKNCGIRYYDYD